MNFAQDYGYNIPTLNYFIILVLALTPIALRELFLLSLTFIYGKICFPLLFRSEQIQLNWLCTLFMQLFTYPLKPEWSAIQNIRVKPCPINITCRIFITILLQSIYLQIHVQITVITDNSFCSDITIQLCIWNQVISDTIWHSSSL